MVGQQVLVQEWDAWNPQARYTVAAAEHLPGSLGLLDLAGTALAFLVVDLTLGAVTAVTAAADPLVGPASAGVALGMVAAPAPAPASTLVAAQAVAAMTTSQIVTTVAMQEAQALGMRFACQSPPAATTQGLHLACLWSGVWGLTWVLHLTCLSVAEAVAVIRTQAGAVAAAAAAAPAAAAAATRARAVASRFLSLGAGAGAPLSPPHWHTRWLATR